MVQPVFFTQAFASTLGDIAALTRAELVDPALAGRPVRGLAALDSAGPAHLTFFDNMRYADDLAATQAGACLIGRSVSVTVPAHVAVLRVAKPFRAFVELARQFQSESLRPRADFGVGIAPSAIIHPTARLEDEVTVDPLAVIGPGVEIGAGTVVGAGAVISTNVRIGRDCSIGAGTSIQMALIGNNVLIHPGCRIGQDGFGFLPGPDGPIKVPQTARVIIQHDVEIGAGTTIDRGSLRDTVIGEGTKIDNQVQIGHNVVIGRHCLIAAQCGLAGSLSLGDNVMLGAKVGVNNHVHIGDGAQIAATSAVKDSVPPGARWGGPVAKPIRTWFREVVAVERLAKTTAPQSPGTADEGQD